MDTLNARPKLLKQANLSMLRRALKSKGTATRAELTQETKISSTTVRSLLTEMLQNREIESIGYDESSGGRKAERYRFTSDRYFSAAFCVTDDQVHALLINVFGEIVETTQLEVTDESFELAITTYLDCLIAQKEIKSIGLGVPGIVEGGCFWRKDKQNDELCKVELGDRLAQRYGIPVVMENDLNATAIGFGRCYEKHFPRDASESMNMAYLHFEKGCVSAGFLAEGRILRGYHQFAGELGLVPMEHDKLLDDCMAEATDNERYTALMIQMISWICGILNPQYVALGGPSLRKECIPAIIDGLHAQLPKQMLAEILYSPDVWHDYYDGMAYITAGKMFDEIQFIKE